VEIKEAMAAAAAPVMEVAVGMEQAILLQAADLPTVSRI
jgi:hypothetical protein